MTTINQLPPATNPQPTDLIPVQTASGTTAAYTPANVGAAMGIGKAAYLPVGGPNGTVVADNFGNISAQSFVSKGSTQTRTLESRGADVVNIMDFGADPTGAADSTTAIQAALNAGSLGVYIPTGTFSFTSLTIPNTPHFTLFGEGKSSILKQTGSGIGWGQSSIFYQQGSFRDFLIDGTNGTGHCINTSGVGGMDFDNIYINNLPVGFDGIHINGAGGVYTHDIRVLDYCCYSSTAGNAGIYFGPLASDSVVSNYIANLNFLSGYGIYFDQGAASIVVSNSHPYNTKTNIICGNGASLVEINGCTLDNCSGGDVVALTNCYRFKFVGGRAEAVNIGFNGISLANCIATLISNFDFDGQNGALACVAETGTSNFTQIFGGAVPDFSNFTKSFQIIGQDSFIRQNEGVNPQGASFAFCSTSQTALTPGSTNFMGCNGVQPTPNATAFIVPYDCYIATAIFAVSNALGAGNTLTINVMVDGATIATMSITGNIFSTAIPFPNIGIYVPQASSLYFEVTLSDSAPATEVRGSVILTA